MRDPYGGWGVGKEEAVCEVWRGFWLRNKKRGWEGLAVGCTKEDDDFFKYDFFFPLMFVSLLELIKI